MKNAILEAWPPGMESKEPEVSRPEIDFPRSLLQCCHIYSTYLPIVTGCRGHCEAIQAPGQPVGGHRESPGERHEDTLCVAAGRHLGRHVGECQKSISLEKMIFGRFPLEFQRGYFENVFP